MPPGTPTASLRKILEDRLSALVPDLESWFETESASRSLAVRRAVAEHFNEVVRLLRGAGDFSGVSAVLADASAPFSDGAAVFRIAAGSIFGERVRGVAEEAADCFAALELPLAAAGNFLPALETGDPIVALGGEGEISAALMELRAHAAGDRVCVFPILAAGKPAGLLYAWGEVEMAALEMLAQVAGLVLAGQAAPARLPDLVAIAAAPSAAPVAIAPVPAQSQPVAPDGEDIAAAVREARLRAQRFARVQVAEMRLYRPNAVRAGRATADLYGALRDSIDAARDIYAREFLHTSPGIIDYLHEELLHTLAHDDAALLGPQYPGALV